MNEAALVERAAAVGVELIGISPNDHALRNGRGGLLFGYGMPTEAEIDEGILVAVELAVLRVS